MPDWLLLRGLGRESGHWMDFPQHLKTLRPGEQVHCLDLPGNGRRCHERSPTSIEDCVAAYRSQCQAQGLQPPYRVVGLSMGGMVGLAWLNQAPQEIDRLWLINSSLANLNPFYWRLRPAAFLQLLPGLWWRAYRERTVLALTCNHPPDAETLLTQWQDMAVSRPVSAINLLRQLRAAGRFRPASPEIEVKSRIHLIGSCGDQLVSPQCSEWISARWELGLRQHPDAGHDLPVDDPRWLAERLSEDCLAATESV